MVWHFARHSNHVKENIFSHGLFDKNKHDWFTLKSWNLVCDMTLNVICSSGPSRKTEVFFSEVKVEFFPLPKPNQKEGNQRKLGCASLLTCPFINYAYQNYCFTVVCYQLCSSNVIFGVPSGTHPLSRIHFLRWTNK